MDQWLASIYGTGGGEDLEKTAQAVMLQKLAEEEGVDLSGLDEAQLEQLADEVLGNEGDVVEDGGIDPNEQYEEAPVVTEEQLAKEAQAKFEEADFLGRVMAHAYTQELEKIGSRAEARHRQAAGTARPYEQKGGLGAKSTAADRASASAHRKAGDKLRQGPSDALNTRINSRKMGPKETTMSMRYHSAKNKLKSGLGSAKAGLRSAGRFAAKHKGPIGAAAGGIAAGALASKAMSKEASAFEKLAFEHAQQILGAAEQQLAQQQAIQQQAMQQQQSPFMAQPQQAQPQGNPQFQQALDERALQILAENGYDVDAIVSQLDGGEGVEGQEGFDGQEGVEGYEGDDGQEGYPQQ